MKWTVIGFADVFARLVANWITVKLNESMTKGD
jgi:hypothetical protein